MDSDPNTEQNTNVSSQAAPAPVAPVAPAPVPAPAPAPTPVTPAPAVQATAPEAKKKNTGLIIAIVVGSLLVIGVIAYIVEKILFPSVVVGDWACTKYSNVSGTPSVEVILNKDGSYMYGEYGDIKNNHFSGKTYEATKLEKGIDLGGAVDYMIKFGPVTEYVSDGVKGDPSEHEVDDLEMIITEQSGKRQATAMHIHTYNTYSCEAK